MNQIADLIPVEGGFIVQRRSDNMYYREYNEWVTDRGNAQIFKDGVTAVQVLNIYSYLIYFKDE